MSNRLLHYVLPLLAVGAVVALFVGLVCSRQADAQHEWQGPTAAAATGPSQVELCEGYPWVDEDASGIRAMHVVLENDGAFIGEQCIPYPSFRPFLIKHAKEFRPHHAMIHGTLNCPFGRGVEVYDTLLSLRIWPIFEPSPASEGIRLPAIEIWPDGEPPEVADRVEREAARRREVSR